MNKDNLVVGHKQLWANSRFYHPGTSLTAILADTPGGTIDDKQLQDYVTHGFLADKDALERARNPEAFNARQSASEAERTIAELRERIAELEQEMDEDGLAQDQVFRLQDQLTRVNREMSSMTTAVAPLLDLLADETGQRPTLADAVSHACAKLSAQRSEQEVVEGTPLPKNFVRYGVLSGAGLSTYESLKDKTAADLMAYDGIQDEQAADIVAKVKAYFDKTGE